MSDNRNNGGRPPRKDGGPNSRGPSGSKFSGGRGADGPRGERPRDDSRKPSFGKDKPDFAKRGKDAGAKSFGDKPSFGKGGKDRKPFSKPGFDKPRRVLDAIAPATNHVTDPEGERIAKVLARVGLCSRRDAELWIEDGRVAINGEVLTSPAINVKPGDRVSVDGKPLAARERTRLFLFHKPRGLVTTDKDPEGRPTVFDHLHDTWPAGPRVMTIGRLDINTEGLLLLTNDGGLARVLELPATGWLRRYRVRANGETDQAQLDRLRDGVVIDGVEYAGIEATLDRVQGANCWLTMGLREGKNREIKRVLEHLGLAVNRLIRLSFGPFQLLDLPEGAVEEVRTRILQDQLGPVLATEAGCDFDTPDVETVRYEAPAAPQGKTLGRPKRGEPVEEERPRIVKPEPGARKHVTALRAAKTRDAAGDRTRYERDATEDRKGRKVAVERIVKARPAQPMDELPNRNARRFQAERFKSEEGKRPVRAVRPARFDGESSPRNVQPWGNEDRSERPVREERSERPRSPRPDGDRPRPARSFEDRPPRAPRVEGDRPRPPRTFDDRPRPPRAEGDRPRTPRPDGDRPRAPRAEGDRPRPPRTFDDRPRPPRTEGDRPRTPRPDGERPRAPRGDRPFGDKPRGERSFGDKPRSAGKSFGGRSGPDRNGDRPMTGRAGKGKPAGSPRGGKPGGGGRPAGGKPPRGRS